MSKIHPMPGLAQYNPLVPSFGDQMDHFYYMTYSHLHSPHTSAQSVLPTPTGAPSSAFLPPFSSPGIMHTSPGLERRTSSTRPKMISQCGQRSHYQPRHSNSLRSPSLDYSSSIESASIFSPPTSSSSVYHQVQQPLASQPSNQMGYSSYSASRQHPYTSSIDHLNDGNSRASSTRSSSMYGQSSAAGHPPHYMTEGISDGSLAGIDASRNVRNINSRPKPQCWEHGCNGRQFSTFSNLLRHQREKSGTAGKSYCSKCHAGFTRTTAMKGHKRKDRCKPRKTSDTGRAAQSC